MSGFEGVVDAQRSAIELLIVKSIGCWRYFGDIDVEV